MTFTCQTNKVVNGAHLELSTETLVKFPRLGLISLDLEKTPQIWLDSDNGRCGGGKLESLIMICAVTFFFARSKNVTVFSHVTLIKYYYCGVGMSENEKCCLECLPLDL